jgi:hypothetical protein
LLATTGFGEASGCDFFAESLSVGEHPANSRDSATKQHITNLTDFIVLSFLWLYIFMYSHAPDNLKGMAQSSAALDHFNFTISSGFQVWSKNSTPLP